MTETINHNFELLDKLMTDHRNNDDILASNNYWINYTKRIERHIRDADLNKMRTNYSLMKGFAWGGVPIPTVSNLYIKRIIFYFLERFFPFTKVVNEYKGTAFQSRSENLEFSGKTGTSQVRKISISERESEDFRTKEIEWKKRDHALFVGYMPSIKPKYSISVIIEHGGSGASTAAPIAKQVFNYIHKLES